MDLSKQNRDQLRKLAAQYKIPGRGSMNKTALFDAVSCAMELEAKQEASVEPTVHDASEVTRFGSVSRMAVAPAPRSQAARLSNKHRKQARMARKAASLR